MQCLYFKNKFRDMEIFATYFTIVDVACCNMCTIKVVLVVDPCKSDIILIISCHLNKLYKRL